MSGRDSLRRSGDRGIGESIGPGAVAAELRRRVGRFANDHVVLVLIGLPILVLTVLFVYPVLWVLYQSLWLPPLDPAIGPRFAPIENYRLTFASPQFYESAGRTVVYAFGSLSLSFTAGLLVALALGRVENRRLRNAYVVVLTTGWAIPVSILALMWRGILRGSEFGLLNRLLLDLGIVEMPVAPLQNGALALLIVTLIDAWIRMPLAMIVFLAGLQSIPHHVYEAARVDGATSFQRFRHVTIPFLRPYMATVALLVWMFAFQAFTVIWSMTGGGPPINRTQTLSLFIYEIGIYQLNFGHGAAASAVLVGVAAILTALYVTVTLDADG